MNPLPSFYDSTPYYRQLLKDFIKACIKNGKRDEIKTASSALLYLESLGYDIEEEDHNLLTSWFENIVEMKFLKDILKFHQISNVEEVILHSKDWIQVVGKKRLEFYGPFLCEEDFQFSLELLSLRNGLLWSPTSPFQSFKLNLDKQSWRGTLVHSSLCAEKGSKLFLRSQRRETFQLTNFGLTEGQEIFFKDCLKQKKNFIICGATGSGKTSLLKAMLETVNKREHIVTLEDTQELNLSSDFCTSLLSAKGAGRELVDFCHYALRMRPDRIVLGEIRSREVIPFLLSLNTGHGGMMASLHSNSALDAIHRLCLLFQIYSGEKGVSYQEILKLICRGIDFIIFVENKEVQTIMEVKGSEGMTPFYETWN
ncbi:MAG: CpaF/VirB11 family protein [Halobacteriovoraceae bacterium]|nr:CpaF/VirB11 family protein [Halobacteriovoraceae bacterium]